MKQRKYLVDKQFQIKYTLIVVVFSSLLFAVLGYQLYHTTLINTEILQIQNPDVAKLVSGQDRQILYLLAGFFILQIASLFVLGILITHRIAGPVFRMHRYLEEIVETGEIKNLNPVRSRDEFQEFFDSLTAVITLFQQKQNERRAKLDTLRTALANQDTAIAKLTAEELSKLL